MMSRSEGTQGLYGLIHDEVEQIHKPTYPLEADMEFSQLCSLKTQWESVEGQSSYEGHSTVSTRSGSISPSPISESPRLADRASSPVSASAHVSDLVSSEASTCRWRLGSPQEGFFPDVATYLDAWAKVSGTGSDEMMSALASLASVLMTSERCEVDDGDHLFDDCLADMNAHFLTSGSEWLSERCQADDMSDDDCLADINTDVLS